MKGCVASSRRQFWLQPAGWRAQAQLPASHPFSQTVPLQCMCFDRGLCVSASLPHLYGLVPALHRVPGLVPLPDQILALLVQRPEVLGSTVKLDLGSLQHHITTTHNRGQLSMHGCNGVRVCCCHYGVYIRKRCTSCHVTGCELDADARCEGGQLRQAHLCVCDLSLQGCLLCCHLLRQLFNCYAELLQLALILAPVSAQQAGGFGVRAHVGRCGCCALAQVRGIKAGIMPARTNHHRLLCLFVAARAALGMHLYLSSAWLSSSFCCCASAHWSSSS